MMYRFQHAITEPFTELRLLGPSGEIACDDWAIEAPPSLSPGVDLAQRLRAADEAIDDGTVLHIKQSAAAGLSTREARLIGLPPFAEVLTAISTHGVMMRPDFRIEIAWKRPSGQAIAGAERCGAWLRIGTAWQRLPYELFTITELIEKLKELPAADTAARMRVIAELRESLPAAELSGTATSSGSIGAMTIAVADAFSLDLTDEGPRSRLVPILHRAGQQDPTPLLSPEQQRIFGDDQFNRFNDARGLYPLGGSTYVVLTPPLRAALSEVRRVQSEPLETKRALLAAPRAFLRQALGEEADTTLLDHLVRETPAYADRVLGLGLWQARVVPWVSLERSDWLGSGGLERGVTKPQRGLLVQDEIIPLTPEQATKLRSKVEAAITAGERAVPFAIDGRTVAIPADAQTQVSLAALEEPEPTRAPSRTGEAEPATVLLIAPNENEVEIEARWTPRSGQDSSFPSCLRTPLKVHQRDGLRWLQAAWREGRSGVLLADDMGLGKTLQALAFFAWLREGMQAGQITRAPLLIVAPTGLLENWMQEHDQHLAPPGLGKIFRAYGKELAGYRHPDKDGRPRIKIEALQEADCVLTTYETLRDYDRDFGKVKFAVIAFDEAQKIKTPGIRLTDASKAMNAEFRVALTGTPVENRLADLWCIVDTVHPAFLGELKRFSVQYERGPDPAELRVLKDRLDGSRGGRPPLLMRRLRRDHLPDLPLCEEAVIEEPMPPLQQEAYERVIHAARGSDSGGILKALAGLRTISLHPAPDDVSDDEMFIATSARLQITFNILDKIRVENERALIFLDDRQMQARLVTLIQRRYKLAGPPMIINGAIPGSVRQARVNKFQSDGSRFDVMILSPRAGGVGLTLTNANHAIHLERWWNPAVEDQCTGRVLRIGQTRPVTVHIPLAVCRGRRSFDQNLHALLERKRELFRETLMPPEVSDDEKSALVQDSIAA
jgi:hypothetical protein